MYYLLVTNYRKVTIFAEYYHHLLGMKKTKTELSPNCKKMTLGIRDTQDLLAGKWKTLIIAALFYNGKMKFMDLKRHIDTIAPKVLSKELKDLEMNYLLTRTVCDTKPITVEYELTELGKSFNTVLSAMGDWGVMYREAVLNQKIS